MWPGVDRLVVRVENDRHREWDESSPTHFEVTQSIPVPIATRALPVGMPGTVGEQYERAIAAVRSLANRALEADVPQIDHLVTVLIRSDALASSRIEQVHASSEELAVVLADLDEDGDAIAPAGAKETQIVAGAVEAVQGSLDQDADAVSPQWFKGLHTALLRADPTLDRRYLGEWRDCPVWIGPSRQRAEFEAPPYQQVPALMDDLIRFISRHDVPDLSRAAIAHAQFETIHPFVDGNGRIGRALIHRIVGGLHVPVPVAHGLLVDLGAYIDGLNAYRAGDLDTWLSTFYLAVESGANAATSLLGSLASLRRRFRERVPTRAGSVTQQLLDDLVGQPVVTSLMIQRTYGVTAARASQLTSQLTDAGILRRSHAWAPTNRKIWVAQEVLESIDAIGEALPRDVDQT